MKKPTPPNPPPSNWLAKIRDDAIAHVRLFSSRLNAHPSEGVMVVYNEDHEISEGSVVPSGNSRDIEVRLKAVVRWAIRLDAHRIVVVNIERSRRLRPNTSDKTFEKNLRMLASRLEIEVCGYFILAVERPK